MKRKPYVSILTPCYNSQEYIQRYLDCILGQTCSDIEIVIINDGSTDKTEEIIFSNRDRLEQKGIKLVYLKKENGGLGSAINIGLKHMTGDFFCWCDSDNFYSDNYIQSHINYFVKNKKCNVLRCDGYLITDDDIEKAHEGGKEFPKFSGHNTNVYDKYLFVNAILEINFHFGCAMIRTSAFDKVVKGRNIYESRVGQNWQILLPVFYANKSYYIDEPMFYFVSRKDSISGQYVNNNPRKMYELYEEHEKILSKVINAMEIEDEGYYLKLIKQKYIIRNWEYAKIIDDHVGTDSFERQYKEKVLTDNIFDEECKRVLNKGLKTARRFNCFKRR